LQADGKIVVGGWKGAYPAFDVVLSRRNPDGSLDTSFGTDGKVVTDFGGYEVLRAMALQPDGKVIAAGDSGAANFPTDFALARYANSVHVNRDFNGDGTSDILFRNMTSGSVYEWQLLNGTIVIAQGSPGGATADWVIAGAGDFNGDGKSDILWRNTNSGSVSIWFLYG